MTQTVHSSGGSLPLYSTLFCVSSQGHRSQPDLSFSPPSWFCATLSYSLGCTEVFLPISGFQWVLLHTQMCFFFNVFVMGGEFRVLLFCHFDLSSQQECYNRELPKLHYIKYTQWLQDTYHFSNHQMWIMVMLELRKYNIFMWLGSVQSLSRVRLFVTPWTAACQASLSITSSRRLPKLVSIE